MFEALPAARRGARLALGAAASLLLALGCATRPPPAPELPPRVTHGPVFGEVRSDSVRVWARGSREGRLQLTALTPTGHSFRVAEAPIRSEDDLTAQIVLDGLEPATAYLVTVQLGTEGEPVFGHFRTAPAPDDAVPVRIAFGGDLGGQNACRGLDDGYPILGVVARSEPDLFVALGDMIYADGHCLARGAVAPRQVPGPPPALDLAGFRAHWQYNRSAPGLQALLSGTASLAVWDDHEVHDDFAYRDEALAAAGARAFREWHPLAEGRLYRSFDWGRHVRLFLLDTRTYRDPNARFDRDEAPSTLLGAAQRDWLITELAASPTTWNVIVSSVPLAIPTGEPDARDGWAGGASATGRERELLAMLREIHRGGAPRLVFVTTDVHYGAHLRHRPLPEARDWQIHELVSGPLHAGLGIDDELDPTLGPDLLFRHQAPTRTPEDPLAWFNFGVLEVSADGHLSLTLTNARSQELWRHTLE